MKKQEYIAFLRAINVGGRNVSMEVLRGYFAELGFEAVRSYIQTGNLFFVSSETDRTALTLKIEKHLLDKLGYEVAAFLRTPEEVEKLLARNPFAEYPLTETTRHLVLFTDSPLPESVTLPFHGPKGDVTIIDATEQEVYLVLDLSKGRVGNPAGYVEKTFKIRATGRFYATIAKIFEASRT